jgi:hypothetical protein
MTKDRLEELLREADRMAAPPPPSPNNLAARAWRRAAAQSRRRMALCSAAAAALLLAIGLSYPFWSRRSPANLGGGNAGTTPLAELTMQLGEEADWRQAVVRKTSVIRDQQSRLAALNELAAQPDSVRTAQREVEQAAGALFQQGDLLYREFGLPQRAAESYREVLRVFPTSTWAGLARERLAELKQSQGDVL